MTIEELENILRELPKHARIAIVGSVQLTGEQFLMFGVYEVLQPISVVSGGAPGIDTLAKQEGDRRGIPVTEYLPKTKRWHDGFKPRNLLVANDCQGLVRIVASTSKTYGSGWTRDRAKDLGKPTAEIVVAV